MLLLIEPEAIDVGFFLTDSSHGRVLHRAVLAFWWPSRIKQGGDTSNVGKSRLSCTEPHTS